MRKTRLREDNACPQAAQKPALPVPAEGSPLAHAFAAWRKHTSPPPELGQQVRGEGRASSFLRPSLAEGLRSWGKSLVSRENLLLLWKPRSSPSPSSSSKAASGLPGQGRSRSLRGLPARDVRHFLSPLHLLHPVSFSSRTFSCILLRSKHQQNLCLPPNDSQLPPRPCLPICRFLSPPLVQVQQPDFQHPPILSPGVTSFPGYFLGSFIQKP